MCQAAWAEQMGPVPTHSGPRFWTWEEVNEPWMLPCPLFLVESESSTFTPIISCWHLATLFFLIICHPVINLWDNRQCIFIPLDTWQVLKNHSLKEWTTLGENEHSLPTLTSNFFLFKLKGRVWPHLPCGKTTNQYTFCSPKQNSRLFFFFKQNSRLFFSRLF